jgi:hypothetical protein
LKSNPYYSILGPYSQLLAREEERVRDLFLSRISNGLFGVSHFRGAALGSAPSGSFLPMHASFTPTSSQSQASSSDRVRFITGDYTMASASSVLFARLPHGVSHHMIELFTSIVTIALAMASTVHWLTFPWRDVRSHTLARFAHIVRLLS